MKFNSQICTTREQSERLVAMGLKPETADMMWDAITIIRGRPVQEPMWSLRPYYYPKKSSVLYDNEEQVFIPAWSLHRLIEMMPENVTTDDWLGVSFDDVSYYHGKGEGMIGWKYYKAGNLYDCIIECYEWLIKKGYFNKKYLV